jgi:poly(ADP-ribose) glycohydrolase ARH3
MRDKKFIGCLMGLALGDALGAPFEGMPSGDYSPPFDGQLTYTDDTEMMMNLTESIIAQRDVDPDSVAQHFVSGLNPLRGYGPGTLKVLSYIRQGIPYERASRMVFSGGSFGNGAAMRIAPVGLLYWWNDERLFDAVVKASTPTHVHPVGIEGAKIIAYTISLLVRGVDKEYIPEAIVDNLEEEVLIRKMMLVQELLTQDVKRNDVIHNLGNSVIVQESVPTAVYAFLKYGESFEEMIKFCLGLGGDTDTISAMAGALSGLHVSDEGIPDGCAKRLENADRIKRKAVELHELSEELAD